MTRKSHFTLSYRGRLYISETKNYKYGDLQGVAKKKEPSFKNGLLGL